jgi:hypothetical protein
VPLSNPIHLALDGLGLEGSLSLPEDPTGLVLLVRAGALEEGELDRTIVHGLTEVGVGALQLGLLTAEEVSVDLLLLELRFDIPLLARRVIGALEWTKTHVPQCSRLGLFGVDTAGAAALVAAARRPDLVDAVALLRGRPDLAISAASRLVTPILLLAGGRDEPGIHWNEIGASHLFGPHEVRTVPGAGQFFAEGGSFARCAELTRDWFSDHFASDVLSQVG